MKKLIFLLYMVCITCDAYADVVCQRANGALRVKARCSKTETRVSSSSFDGPRSNCKTVEKTELGTNNLQIRLDCDADYYVQTHGIDYPTPQGASLDQFVVRKNKLITGVTQNFTNAIGVEYYVSTPNYTGDISATVQVVCCPIG